jgi:hypothetical protein
MGVHIDETRRDHESSGIDHGRSRRFRNSSADRSNLPICDEEVCLAVDPLTGIDETTAPQHQRRTP